MTLRTKIFLPLALLSVLFFLFLYGYWFPHSMRIVEQEELRATERHLDTVAEGLVPLLLAHELDTVYENLGALLGQNREWVGIRLADPGGRSIYPLQEAEPAVPPGKNVRIVEHRIRFLGNDLGNLTLTLDTSARTLGLERRHRQLVTALLAVICGYLLTVGIIVERIVRRPVDLLARAAGRMAQGDFEAALTRTGNDEVGILVDSFAQMRDAIREYQASLLESNQAVTRLSQAVRQSPVSIMITDTEGRLTFVNPRFSQVTGYSAEEVLGENPRFLKSGTTPAAEYEALWRTITSGGIWCGELYNRRKNGEFYWEAASISPIMDDNGAIVSYLAVKEDITERIRADEALRKSVDEVHDLYNRAPCGYHSLDKDGLIIRINDTELQWLGYEREEVLDKKNIFELMTEKSLQVFRQRYPEFKERGWARDLEFEMVRKDGSVLPVLVSATAIFDDNGRYVMSRSTVYDITERRRAEESLRESAALLRAAFDNAPFEFWVRNREGYCVMENTTLVQHWGSILGLRPEGTPVSPETLATWQDNNRRAFGGEVVRSEVEYVEEGEQRVYDNIVAPVRIDEEIWGILGFNIDISERKRAEHEIRHLKNYLSNIIDSMPSMLVGMDRNEIVTQWNRQAESATGIPTSKALGRPLAELIPDFSPWIEAMRNEVEQRRPASLEKLLLEKEGKRSFYDLMLYPLIANGIEGTVVRIDDVTEQARIQELMVQTEKMMSVGGLAAGMAHEINNPLGIITQAAQNIERRVSPDLAANQEAAVEAGISMDALTAYFQRRQIPEFIGSIREAGSRAARIIANILRFSRRTDEVMRPTPPADIVEQALELAANDYDLKKRYDFRSIEIVREFEPGLPDIPMVGLEIEQVILNLLKNAAQAMAGNPPECRPRIILRLKRLERHVLLEVEDNGHGMTEEVRRRAFDPFFTTKEPGVGTGLGLSVSYMIVTRNHKGLMEVASAPGNGARFTVKLPLYTESTHD